MRKALLWSAIGVLALLSIPVIVFIALLGPANGFAATLFLLLRGLIVPVALLLIGPLWSLCILSQEFTSKSKGVILVGVNMLTTVLLIVLYVENISSGVSRYLYVSRANDENERKFHEFIQTHHRIQSIEMIADKNHKGIQLKAIVLGGRSGDYGFRLKLGWTPGVTPESGIREVHVLDGSACNRDQISLQTGTEFISCLIPCAGLKDLPAVPNQEVFKGGFTLDTHLYSNSSSEGHIFGHENEIHELGMAHITVDAPWLNDVRSDCKSE